MIAISMRIVRHVYPDGSEELRNALACDWNIFFLKALPGRDIVCIPNTGARVVQLLEKLPLSGLVLSGGEDLGIFPERDSTEEAMFLWAREKFLPILGICRGAQLINKFMGGSLRPLSAERHVRKRHRVQICKSDNLPELPDSMEVNSWHNLGIMQQNLACGLITLALAGDNSVEAFLGENDKIIGLMWHPEREKIARTEDIILFQHIFGKKL